MNFTSRFFFKCKECDFMISLLGQADRTIDCCPSCGEADIDYAPKEDREKYIENLRDELEHIDD